jgi:hypothetical protein
MPVWLDITGVVVGILLALGGAARWFWPRRDEIITRIRQGNCRHVWEPINKPGDVLPIVTQHDEWCVKCGKERRRPVAAPRP